MIDKLIEKYNKKLKTEEQFLKTYKTTPPSMRIGNTSEAEINLGIMRYKEILQDLEKLKKHQLEILNETRRYLSSQKATPEMIAIAIRKIEISSLGVDIDE